MKARFLVGCRILLATIVLVSLEACATLGDTYPPGLLFRDCATCPELVVVPPGRVMMGSPAAEAGHQEYEAPQVEVEIEWALAVGVYELTFAEWNSCVDAGACEGHEPEDEGWGQGSRPVINVSWLDAQEYLNWLSAHTGYEYRLLSEAEWEYVARAGTTTARHWGESEADQCRFANGGDAAAPCPDGHPRTAPVGSLEPNALGLHDTLGNVWEWTQDCVDDDYSGVSSARGRESGDCSQRMVRGGSWFSDPGPLRSASRGWYPAEARRNEVGFRVARGLD